MKEASCFTAFVARSSELSQKSDVEQLYSCTEESRRLGPMVVCLPQVLAKTAQMDTLQTAKKARNS